MALLVQLTDEGAAMMVDAVAPIVLDTFKLGSNYGYIPDPSQTDIQGTLVYTGIPSNPIIQDGNYLLYACNLGEQLGHFYYGELGLFKGSVLFAICVFETEQQKLPLDTDLDIGGNVVIDIHTPVTDPNYVMWADVTASNTFKLNVVNAPHRLPPARGANPNVIMVKPPSSMRPGFLAYTDRLHTWQYENYVLMGKLEIISADLFTVTVDMGEAQALMGDNAIYPDGERLLQFASGDLIGITRYCQRKQTVVSDTVLNLSVPVTNAPLPGDFVNVYIPNSNYQLATEDVAGAVRLTKANSYLSTSDSSAATPAYVNMASGGGAGVYDAFDAIPSNPFVLNTFIGTDRLNYDLRQDAIAQGWNGTDFLQANVEIGMGVYLGSSSSGLYAFDTGTNFPGGFDLSLRNRGFIVGKGGDGAATYGPGSNGGPALRAQVAITVNNLGGVIGGGGGGAGYSHVKQFDVFTYLSGGPGAQGYQPGLGGAVTGTGALPAVNGTKTAPGSVAGITGPGAPSSVSGGTLGQPGTSAGSYTGPGSPPNLEWVILAPGSAGSAVVGNANIVWQQTGTIAGSVS